MKRRKIQCSQQGGRQGNNFHNKGNQDRKRGQESSPGSEFIPYVNEFGDEIYNMNGARRTIKRRNIITEVDPDHQLQETMQQM